MGAHTSRTLEVLYPYSRKSLLESHFWNLGSSSFEEKKPKSSLTVVDYITFNQKTNYIYCAEYFFNGTNSVVSQKYPTAFLNSFFTFATLCVSPDFAILSTYRALAAPKDTKVGKMKSYFFSS